MPWGQWVRSPKASGPKIPQAVQARTEQHLLRYAEAHLAGRYTRIEIWFRGAFCYVDAYEEPKIPDNFPPQERGETHEEGSAVPFRSRVVCQRTGRLVCHRRWQPLESSSAVGCGRDQLANARDSVGRMQKNDLFPSRPTPFQKQKFSVFKK